MVIKSAGSQCADGVANPPNVIVAEILAFTRISG
jgi:hypothetical protein